MVENAGSLAPSMPSSTKCFLLILPLHMATGLGKRRPLTMDCTERCCGEKLLHAILKTYIKGSIPQYHGTEFCSTGPVAHLPGLTGHETFNGIAINGDSVLLKCLTITFNENFKTAGGVSSKMCLKVGPTQDGRSG